MVRPEDQAFVRWRNAGDADALAQVYDLAAPALLRLALHHVRHPATAEDLVQATFVAAIQNAGGYDPARPLLGWLVGILHNQAKWLQRREGRAVDAARLPDRAPGDPLAAAQSAEFTAQCDEAIEGLPEAYRPVLRLHLKHELGAAEIAHALGRPPGTVRSQITRGLELLRAALPAGIALAAFALLTPGRGLAAVREVVLATGRAQAATVLATAATTKAIVGGVTMKEALFGVAALFALATGAWWFTAGRADGAPGAPLAAAPAAAVAPVPAPDAGAGAESPAAFAPPLRAPALPASASWQLVGRVVDSAEQAVANAVVRVVMSFEGEAEALAEARSGTDGRYTVDFEALRALPPIDLDRAELTARIDVPGQLPVDTRVALPHRDPAQNLVVVLDAQVRPYAVLAGRVVDDQGTPVAGAQVSLRSVADGGGTSIDADTDAQGRYRFGLPAAAAVAVTAEHNSFGRAQARCELAMGQDHVADLVLRASSTLRARVTFEDGEPVRDVSVGVYERGSSGSTVAMADTDRDGWITVRTLEPGSYQLRAQSLADDAMPSPVVATHEDPATIVLAGIHQVRFRFQDDAGRSLRPMDVGCGRWPAEKAAAAAAFAAGAALTEELEDGFLNAAGALPSLLVSRGAWVRVHASHRDAHGEAMLQVLPPQNVYDVVVTLRELVRSATLRLNLASADAAGAGDVAVELNQLHLGVPGCYELECERTGASLLARWYPGRYRLEVKPKATGSELGWFAPFAQVVELRRNEETVLDEVVRVGGRVRLHVHAPDPAQRDEIEDFAVETPAAMGVPGWRTFVQTRPDGWSRSGSAPANVPLLWWPVLPPGQHALTIRSRDYAEQTVHVTIEPRAATDAHVWLQPR